MDLVELLDKKCLLGEFYEYSKKPCNFNRIVKWCLITAEGYLSNGNLVKSKYYYDRLL